MMKRTVFVALCAMVGLAGGLPAVSEARVDHVARFEERQVAFHEHMVERRAHVAERVEQAQERIQVKMEKMSDRFARLRERFAERDDEVDGDEEGAVNDDDTLDDEQETVDDTDDDGCETDPSNGSDDDQNEADDEHVTDDTDSSDGTESDDDAETDDTTDDTDEGEGDSDDSGDTGTDEGEEDDSTDTTDTTDGDTTDVDDGETSEGDVGDTDGDDTGSTDGEDTGDENEGTDEGNAGDEGTTDGGTITPSTGKVLITEVLFNPGPTDLQGTDTNNEWVEIFNDTLTSVNIEGWSVSDGVGVDVLATTTHMLLPGEHLLFMRSTTTNTFWEYGANTQVVYLWDPLGSAGLANTAESVVLYDSNGVVIDAVSWGDPTSFMSPAVDLTGIVEGQSIARTPSAVDSDTGADWALTAPTPGV